MMIGHPEASTKYEEHKQDQLKKQKEGKGHWKPELASNSEEAVCTPSFRELASLIGFRMSNIDAD